MRVKVFSAEWKLLCEWFPWSIAWTISTPINDEKLVIFDDIAIFFSTAESDIVQKINERTRKNR